MNGSRGPARTCFDALRLFPNTKTTHGTARSLSWSLETSAKHRFEFMYVRVCVCVYIYIYIYAQNQHICVTHIYIYIYAQNQHICVTHTPNYHDLRAHVTAQECEDGDRCRLQSDREHCEYFTHPAAQEDHHTGKSQWQIENERSPHCVPSLSASVYRAGAPAYSYNPRGSFRPNGGYVAALLGSLRTVCCTRM